MQDQELIANEMCKKVRKITSPSVFLNEVCHARLPQFLNKLLQKSF